MRSIPVVQEPPQRVIAAGPVWRLALELVARATVARDIQDDRYADVLENISTGIREAVKEGMVATDVSTSEAAAVLQIDPDSVATACRRGRFPGAQKIAGQWRIPLDALNRGKAA